MVIAAIGSAGAGTSKYLSRYVTHDDLASDDARLEALERLTIRLGEGAAKREADISAIQRDVAEMRSDMRELLRGMLAHPPPRRGRP